MLESHPISITFPSLIGKEVLSVLVAPIEAHA